MRTEIIAAAGIVAVSIFTVRFVNASDGVAMPEREAAGRVASVTPAPSRAYANEVRIAASADHQFYINVEVNRRVSQFLVDTGASYVALRDSDARDAGIYTSWTDYTYPVHTANGETKAAFVTIDEIEIDGIRVEGVKAFVLKDDQLNINLLGMSFLSQLESVEARKGQLLLKG